MMGLSLAAAAIGFSGTLTQLTLLREFLSVYGGNELAVCAALGLWLLLTGIGSYIGGRLKVDERRLFACSLFPSAFLMPLTVYVSRALGTATLLRGEAPGPHQMIPAVGATMAAYCILYGVQITLVMRALEKAGRGKSSGYILDSAGSALGGALFSFLFVGFLDPFQTAYVAAAVNLAAAAAISPRLRMAAGLSAALLLCLPYFVDLQSQTESLQYPGQRILAESITRYGSLVATESMGQFNFFENGIPLFATNNVIAAEETVHYPMSQRRTAKKVLLVGGGVSGTLAELLKYPVERVDYVELDPEVIRLARKYVPGGSLQDARVSVINTDGRLYVKTAQERYDVIIVDLPPPSNTQLNRYYTVEFFKEVKRILAPDGVFSTKLGGTEDYWSEDTKALNAGLFRTLREAYARVVVVPAGSNIYLASNAPLEKDVISAVDRTQVMKRYVNSYYMRGVLTKERMDYAQDAVSTGGRVNTDERPDAYRRYMDYWASQYNMKAYVGYAIALLLLLFCVSYLMLKPVQAGIFSAGFTGMAVEIAIILSFQAAYGYVYQEIGFIVAAFMAGLVLGAHYMNARTTRRPDLKSVAFALGGYCILLSAAMPYAPPQAYVPITGALGALVGAAFPAAARTKENIGSLLGLDFLGAFAGSILATTILMPTIGLLNTCALTGILNIVSWGRLNHGKKTL